MPVNNSTSKVRVTKLFGTDSMSGMFDPKVDMQVRHGIDTRWIKNLSSGNYTVDLALESGGAVVGKAYPHDLKISETVAGYFGWPTADGSTMPGHSGVFPAGVPFASGNGFAYHDGDGNPTTFTR